MKHIGDTIRKILNEKNIKKSDLAKHLNITPQALQSILNTDNISFRTLIKISEYVMINLNDFLDNDSILLNIDSETQRNVFELLKEKFERVENDIKELKKQNAILLQDLKKLSQK